MSDKLQKECQCFQKKRVEELEEEVEKTWYLEAELNKFVKIVDERDAKIVDLRQQLADEKQETYKLLQAGSNLDIVYLKGVEDGKDKMREELGVQQSDESQWAGYEDAHQDRG